MKLFKPLIILFFSIYSSSIVLADTILIPVNGNKKEKEEEEHPNSGRLRRHYQSPVEVWLNTDSMVILLEYYGEEEGSAYLYNSNGSIVDFLPSLNGELTIPVEGTYHLYLCSDSWEASAEIEI